MATITIPKKLTTKGDLIVIPRIDYEKLLKFQKKYRKIDCDLDKAVSQVKQGKAVGPFNSVKELKKSLEK